MLPVCRGAPRPGNGRVSPSQHPCPLACSATPAGWSRSGPGCPGGLFLRGGLNADPFGVPGRDSRAEPPCTVGAAALPPSGSVSGKADIGLVTKVILFYNGCGLDYIRFSPRPTARSAAAPSLTTRGRPTGTSPRPWSQAPCPGWSSRAPAGASRGWGTGLPAPS